MTDLRSRITGNLALDMLVLGSTPILRVLFVVYRQSVIEYVADGYARMSNNYETTIEFEKEVK